ncbi:MAG: M48 family metallopeptidase [Spirochaetales bacterium]|jgi:Zn-dependent protease with chaperone function|nr:M48 family metallopeptidase [Spirochaetales bacterium]
MDFFQSQDIARHNTTKLVAFFILAVVAMVILTNLLVMFSLGYLSTEAASPQPFDWQLFLVIGAGVVALVVLGSGYKVMSLSGGGARIAELMNGQLIVDGSDDPDKQRILNVVEEMAIAAGTPVPPVYLLDESAINAFAAGYSPSDAVIGVTKGAIQKLSRDELQGVVAHEFSHILNGDMRLNIRLMGILHGILLLGLIGYSILRFSPRSRNSKGGGGVMALGFGLIVIGYVGTFFGNLIKASVSRQREYLADAAAVQFTRNPEGIGGALIRIGAGNSAGILENPKSSEISHAFFCQGVSSTFESMMATHPPLAQRIKRIVPTWNGEFTVEQRAASAPPSKAKSVDQQRRKDIGMSMAGAAVLSQGQVMQQVGNPTSAHFDYARNFMKTLPAAIKKAAHDPYGARGLVYCLVLATDEKERAKQLEYLQAAADTGVYAEVEKLYQSVGQLKTEQRLPVIDMTLGTLRQLSAQQYQLFKDNLVGLIESDGKINLFEWSLQKIIFHHLNKVFEPDGPHWQKEPSLKRAKEASTILLSFLASAVEQNGVSQQQAFAAAKKEMAWLDTEVLAQADCKLAELDLALDDLARLKPRFKAILLKGCLALIMVDEDYTADEGELLRAIADTLDCPMPPLVG